MCHVAHDKLGKLRAYSPWRFLRSKNLISFLEHFQKNGLLSYRVQTCNSVSLAHGKVVGSGGKYVPQQIFL